MPIQCLANPCPLINVRVDYFGVRALDHRRPILRNPISRGIYKMTSLRKFSTLLLVVASLAGSAVAAVTLNCNNSSLPAVLSLGTSYTFSCSALGGTGSYTYSESGALPPGMTAYPGISQETISGAPSVQGTYTFAVTATDTASSTGSSSITLTVGT